MRANSILRKAGGVPAVIGAAPAVRDFRLNQVAAAKQALAILLVVLGIPALEVM